MFHNLLKLLFPERCILCGQVTKEGAVCKQCADKLVFCRDIRICKKCSRPISEEQLLCEFCASTPRSFTACFAPVVYTGELRRSILKYKFYQHPEYHRGYAKLIFSHLLSLGVLPHFDLVVAAPLSKERMKERGYNQAQLIAKELARLMGLPFAKNCVRKIQHTAAQSTLSHQERLKNVSNAFSVVNAEAVCGKTVLLTDDILTTGSTADEVAKQLLKAGAKQVYVAVVAVTPPKDFETDAIHG